MSDLSQLKSQLHAIAGDAQSTSGQIASFQSKFSRAINEVQQRIGGSATGTDKQIIEILQGASKAVKDASEALSSAAKSARGYADSI
jgi:methyl-accepting chemotaxis protein